MENTGHNGHGETRMDRLERLMDLLITDHVAFSDEHKKLLTAQVVLTDRVDKNAIAIKELRDAQKETDRRLRKMGEDLDRRLSALVSTVGKIVGHLPSL
jgi:hypothetical protein